MRHRSFVPPVILLVLALIVSPAAAQTGDSLALVLRIANGSRPAPNITDLTVDGTELKLDVYQSRAAPMPRWTLAGIHGGNWVGGSDGAPGSSL